MDYILILTPVKNAEPVLEIYFKNLCQLCYPHENISLGLLESDSEDNTWPSLQDKLPALQREFRKAGIWKKDFGFHIPRDTPRWAGAVQLERRSILAKCRNHLLLHALDDEDWVLWLDVDIIEYPADIIQRLLRTGKEIIQPNCVREYHGKSYDLNAWKNKGKEHLHDLRGQGDVVELHAVGGTVLLVKADVHRDGLVFPPFLYGRKNKRIRTTNYFFANRFEMVSQFTRIPKNLFKGIFQGEIETEGLGIMANDMGHKCWGMPNTEVKHK